MENGYVYHTVTYQVWFWWYLGDVSWGFHGDVCKHHQYLENPKIRELNFMTLKIKNGWPKKDIATIIHRQQWVDLFISDIATIEPWDSPEPRDSPDPIGKDQKPEISPNRGFPGTSWFCQSDLHQQPGNFTKTRGRETRNESNKNSCF